MADPNLVNFYANVAHFERRHAKGYAFEAVGTVGRTKPFQRRKSRSWLRPLILVAVSFFALKGMIYHSVGAKAYDNRVASLETGEGFDRLGGFLMRADPVTQLMAQGITAGLKQLPK
jgi:hypothetical protein